jgi:glycerophosphoryl diester phosphodiesterase
MLNRQKVLVIAHRGASFYAPENSMPAFELAVEMGAEMIELDVLLSSDGVPVVIHDADLTRLAGIKKDIRTLTKAEIGKLDVGSRFHSKYSGTPVPLLSEVLDWASGKIALNVEIKPESVTDMFEGGVEEKVIQQIREREMEDQVLMSGFDLRSVERFQRHAPDIAKGLLYTKENSTGLAPAELVDRLGAVTLHLSKWDVKSRLLRDMAVKNCPVMAYTVNRKWEMRRLIRKGVRGIFSDRPDVLKNVVSAYA